MRRTTEDIRREGALQRAVKQVGLTTEALHEARLGGGPLRVVHEDFAAADAALESAIGAARAGGTAMRLTLNQLRTRQQELRRASLSSSGVHVPTCARTSSLAADGPHIAGMGFEPCRPVDPVRIGLYGLNLTAALNPVDWCRL